MWRLGLIFVALTGCLYPDLDELTECAEGCGAGGAGGEAGAPEGGAGGAGGAGGQGGAGGSFVPVTYEEHILFEEPQAYYRLGDLDDVAAIATDEMGARDGEYRGSVVLGADGAIAGDDDKAVEIQDGNDGYDTGVFMGDNFGFPEDASFTFEYWIKPTTTDLFGFSIFGKNTQAAQHPGLYATTLWVDGPYVPFFCRRSERAASCVQGEEALATDRWTFLAVTYNSPTLKLFVDGERVASRSTDPPLEMPEQPDEDFRIGNIDGFGILEAYVDEFAVWNRALPEAVIKRHFRVGVGLPPEEL